MSLRAVHNRIEKFGASPVSDLEAMNILVPDWSKPVSWLKHIPPKVRTQWRTIKLEARVAFYVMARQQNDLVLQLQELEGEALLGRISLLPNG